MADPQTIVLIHGLWMTAACWDGWVSRYEDRGHRVVATSWPGIDGRTPAEVRAAPEGLRNIGLRQVADHYDRIVRSLSEPPIIVGHSFGGVIAQMLADRGLGAACVGLETGQTAGVPRIPLSTARTGLPVLSNPFSFRGASPISRRHFHYTFGNDLSRAESDIEWEKYAINAYNRVLFEGVAAVLSSRGVSRVDYGRQDRAPLLVVTGEEDHVVPPAIGRALVRTYQRSGSSSTVELIELAGRTHRIVTQDGWEEAADLVLDWARANARG